jgi:mono/diheme cytochrome c family protein
MSMTTERGIRSFLLSFVCGYLSATFASAQAPPVTDSDQTARGATLFRIHCASCHGKQGEGDGPVAPALRTKPANLTTLTRLAGGKFPSAEVEAAIDGRTDIRAHGIREMPVWGLSLGEPGRDAQRPGETEAEIKALVRHLQTLQRP